MRPMRRGLGLAALLLAALAVWSQAKIDAVMGTFRPQHEVLYLWSGEHVKRLVPGFEDITADVYWLRTVQYFGGQRVFSREKRFEILGPLIDITTTLDPRMEIAYRYGAIFLCEPRPVGAGRPREGIAVLEKGARNLPRSWRLRQDLGFFHYLFLDNPQGAAAILQEAAALPGAALWLKTLAADILAKGGDRPSARRMWEQMHAQAEEGILRQNARVRLQIYDSLDRADHLAELVAELRRRTGKSPRRLEALQAAGLWKGPLTDAAGVPFAYDEGSGRVGISPASPMWRPY